MDLLDGRTDSARLGAAPASPGELTAGSERACQLESGWPSLAALGSRLSALDSRLSALDSRLSAGLAAAEMGGKIRRRRPRQLTNYRLRLASRIVSLARARWSR